MKEIDINKNDRKVNLTLNKDSNNYHLIIEFIGKYKNIILTKSDFTILEVFNKIPYLKETNRALIPSYKYKELINEQQKSVFNDKFDLNNINDFYGIGEYLKSILVERSKSEDIDSLINNLINSKDIYLHENKYHFLYKDINDTKYSLCDFLNTLIESKKETENSIEEIINKKVSFLKSSIYKLEENLKINLDYVKTNIKANEILEKSILNDDDDLKKEANALFDLSKKQKRSIIVLKEKIKGKQDKLNELKNLKTDDKNTFQYLKNEGYIKDKIIVNKDVKASNIKHYHYKNIQISVGKNSSNNEYLTLKYSKPEEYFFHVKDYPVAHVVVHNISLNNELIEFAATLAIKNSKAKDKTKIIVNYCKIKDVKKLKGSKSGQVIIKNYKEIII